MNNERVDSRDIISDYIFFSKYSRVKPDGKKETWNESVDRVMAMHSDYLLDQVSDENKNAFIDCWWKVKELYYQKKILGSQRALQYGGPELLKNHLRLYNCSASYCDRVDFFKELAEILLSGAGTGYSVQKCHTEKLPVMIGVDRSQEVVYQIPDSIEGWACSWGKLIESYYYNTPKVKFDYSLIRPEGAFVSGGFKAPGPEPLKKSHEKISAMLDKIQNRKLRPFELHYLTCIIANAVISGGIRRSAMICMFDIDDIEMLSCKTGDWFVKFPELCRANNSVVILPNTSKSAYKEIIGYIRQFGEPGIIFTESQDYVYNPCAEVGLFPQFNQKSGWGFCNLCEINGAKIQTEQDFYDACEGAAILGTFQAAYTQFPILNKTSVEITERDALIGVGITGMADNPDILFNEEIQRKGAKIVKETNERVSKILGINTAARTTVIKPSGNSSQLLKCGSGIHSYHFRKYIRHIQAANTEQSLQEIDKINPHIIEPSVYNPSGESVLAFPIELDDKALVRTEIPTIEFLKRIYLTKTNWIEEGTNWNHLSTKENPSLRMNVSCTVSVKDEEWDEVTDWIWDHKKGFCGLSFLPECGDLEYPQAPYTSYLDEKELAAKYGAGAILSSGLIVDGLKVFDNIYIACDAALGRADEKLYLTDEDITQFITKNIKNGHFLVEVDGLSFSDVNAVIDHLQNKMANRRDWVRRFNKFAANYFNGDKIICSHCLKHVNIFHKWQKIIDQKPIDWENVQWERVLENAGSQVGTACSGGKCEI